MTLMVFASPVEGGWPGLCRGSLIAVITNGRIALLEFAREYRQAEGAPPSEFLGLPIRSEKARTGHPPEVV